jgi:O-acetyl-ADP-ribose deacetylase (regulator of RNase III)
MAIRECWFPNEGPPSNEKRKKVHISTAYPPDIRRRWCLSDSPGLTIHVAKPHQAVFWMLVQYWVNIQSSGRSMTKFKWTNTSVTRLAEGEDPVAVMERKARNLALRAIDAGWKGPPFNPLALAELLAIPTEARSDIADARTVPVTKTSFRLEYNPLRPHGRLRFSIAHEIAHTLFPDCADAVRHRGARVAGDDWQLEALCNIGAAELLMPSGSFTELAGEALSIENVLKLRKQFDVSVEACLIRLIKLSRKPIAAFCASAHSSGRYKLDYVIPAAGWDAPVGVGTTLPVDSAFARVSAIGYTAVGDETWAKDVVLHVEGVGLAPYPGQINPRVVGLFSPRAKQSFQAPTLKELQGDALAPKQSGARIVAHVVPNTPAPWGGGGFAAQVRRRFPNVWSDYRLVISSAGGSPRLGSTFMGELSQDTAIVHMVAQQGFGASDTQRLRYAALAQCLGELRHIAEERGASVHMPRIGTGHGGASWDIVRELIVGELVDHGVATTVYQRPS